MTPPPIPFAYDPDSVRPPGETLKEQLDALGIPQADLARRTGLSTKHINQIVQGTAVLTPETALLLERTTKIPASMWNQLEAAWRTHITRDQELQQLGKLVDWLDKFSLSELVKRKILPNKEKSAENLQRLLAFFGVADPEVAEDLWRGYRTAFRRSTVLETNDYATAIWLRQAELRARDVPCEPFDRAVLTALLPRLRALTLEKPETWPGQISDLCAQAGVAVVFIPAPPHSHVSGATRWLTPDKVGIALSDRFKKDDHFWFTVFHEIGHVLLHGKRLTFLDNTDRKDERTPEGDRSEEEANAFAAETLIPPEHSAAYRRLAIRPMPFTNIEAFARQAGLAPGIVVGRLQHDDALDWTHGNKYKRTVHLGLTDSGIS
ncbi:MULTISPECIES: ImmA/IrrE family metallo-endopeptidase [Streptomyces]|uniref:XRE family transcriptional regulator n=1 Tax=Streptomyces TaxID=1883 RepID=UPI000A3BFE65|nr:MULTISPECIES: ImmA/IrrE family metallo-endopeptidase [Streptomyces]MDX3637138.1 ImmA/IrrE family metallo-endopeptidase [Streptomyces europaeiscabiei]MDX3655282.1 ImmA/IrrE family metallo-endopeptidase [Streptomyces europaeiscabiei]WRZ53620.1 ImmA/IrrE family metallo-endopeptidase [Streptomyces sp. NBC_01314]